MRLRRTTIALSLLAATFGAAAPTTAPAAAPSAVPTVADECAPYRQAAGTRTESVSDAAPGSGPLRVFAIQYKQLVGYVQTYQTFAMKMECLMRDYVDPYLDPSKTNLVVFNEDIGLATIATGTRGLAARTLAGLPAPGSTSETYDATGIPAGAAMGLAAVGAGYAKELAAYRLMFPDDDPRKAIVRAATDTFVRGFTTVFSEIARRHGVWVVASNNQGDFRYSTDPAEVAAFMDPDLAPLYADGTLDGVWVAESTGVWNNAFLWGPTTLPQGRMDPGTTDVPGQPNYDPRSNLLFTNQKTPLTQIEKDFLALDEGTMLPSNTGPVQIPGLSGFNFGFAISLPAFMFGAPFGQAPPAGRECDSPDRWMACLHARGVNTIIQPEANPGPWARYGADGGRFQSLTWGASTVRIVTDPALPNFTYVVCPHMVGNLIDLPFDGQSAILQRGRTGAARSYAGAWATTANDDGYAIYAGDRPEFLALAPWVLESERAGGIDADRARLHQRATEMMAGSRTAHENGYLETAIYADLATPA